MTKEIYNQIESDAAYIKDKIISYKEVLGMHELMIHNYGVNINYISVHLEVNKSMKLKKINIFIDFFQHCLFYFCKL